MEINYKDKYLKYKTKYVMLKDINQVGNGKKINQKTCGCLCKECKNCEECKICKHCNCQEYKNCKDCKDCK